MNLDLLHVLLALALLGLMVWLPGLAALRLLAPQQSRIIALAAAPAAGAALLYCTGELLTALDLPVDSRLPLSIAAVSVPALFWRERKQWRAWTLGKVPRSVVCGAAISTTIWCLGIRHLGAVPPHNDGLNHGFFVARIARFHTLSPSVAMPHDVVSGGHGVSYYPLALHQQAAVLVNSLHVDVALAWTLTSLSLTALALPLGMFAVARDLFPQHARAVAATPVVAALMPGVTYSTSWWGGFALAAGLSLCPGTYLCVISAIRGHLTARSLLLSGLALAGVAGVHSSEFSFLAVTCGTVALVEAIGEHAARRVIRACSGVVASFGIALVLLVPVWAQLHSGLNERSYPVTDYGLSMMKSVGEVAVVYSFVPPATPAAIVLSVWLGLVLIPRHRTARGWLCAWLVFASLFVWLAANPGRLVFSLTSTWYSDRFRIGYLLAFLAIPLVALAVAGPDSRAAPRRRRTWSALALALAAVLGVTSFMDSVHGIRENYRNYSLAGPDARAAFAFLAARVRPGERVLNQHQDGSPWMYALAGVAPTVALKSFDYERPEWSDVNYLLRNVQAAGHDARVDALLKAFNVRFVYVGAKSIPTERPDIDSEALAKSPALQVVFDRNGTRVYEVVEPRTESR